MPKLLKKKLADRVRGKTPRDQRPVWEGPDGEGPNGGITQSLLGRFLCCRERFRILVVEGLRPEPRFQHRLGYGDMWHLCEEHHAAKGDWRQPLLRHCKQLAKQYPMDAVSIVHWYSVCEAQFSVYEQYWKPDKNGKPLLQEEVFDYPYMLQSGRIVRLRGKWDSVEKVGREGLRLQENKTKGEVDEQGIQQQLLFDLQTMFYLTAIQGSWPQKLIKGVCYNVVRRPLAGGKHSIRQRKPTKSNPNGETEREFYDRLKELIKSEPEFFFMRWTVEITNQDVDGFREQFLDPTLEQLCDWWEWIKADPHNPFREGNRVHHRYPHGVFNATLEGRGTDVDEYLNTGNRMGLARVDNLFGELDA